MKAFVLLTLVLAYHRADAGLVTSPRLPPIRRGAAMRNSAPRAQQSWAPALTPVEELLDDLVEVRLLRPADNPDSANVQFNLWAAAGLNPIYKVSGGITGEPSFTSLFTHATWTKYTGKPPFRRWMRALATWKYSTIFAGVWPIAVMSAGWAYLIAAFATSLPRVSAVPSTLMGTALGLLLVFRTTNTYQRLAEARALWGRAVFLCREVAQSVATALTYAGGLPQKASATAAAARVGRLVVAYAYELNAKLTGIADGSGGTRDLVPGERDDVLRALLPESEASWVAAQRSRPLVLLGALRRELHKQWEVGNLPPHLHRKLDEDVRELDLVVGGCERLFSSPVPPTMSRHTLRSLALWLLALPFALKGTMAPGTVAMSAFATAYVYVGIEELGVQVEQPFELIPMTRICAIVTANVEEAFSAPPDTK